MTSYKFEDVYVVDSYGPMIYKIDKEKKLKQLIIIDPSYTIVGISASKQIIYVHVMDVTEYLRFIHIYQSNGEFVRKLETSNVLGASIALIKNKLIISSRDKLAVYSSDGLHVKDIFQTRRCIRKVSPLWKTKSVIVTCCSTNQVVRLDVESGEVIWATASVIAPVASACDKFGRVYVLTKPSHISVLNSETGGYTLRL